MHIICTPYALCTFQSFHRSPLTRRLPVVSPRRSLDFSARDAPDADPTQSQHAAPRCELSSRPGPEKDGAKKCAEQCGFSWGFTRGFGWDLAMMIMRIYENI